MKNMPDHAVYPQQQRGDRWRRVETRCRSKPGRKGLRGHFTPALGVKWEGARCVPAGPSLVGLGSTTHGPRDWLQRKRGKRGPERKWEEERPDSLWSMSWFFLLHPSLASYTSSLPSLDKRGERERNYEWQVRINKAVTAQDPVHCTSPLHFMFAYRTI